MITKYLLIWNQSPEDKKPDAEELFILTQGFIELFRDTRLRLNETRNELEKKSVTCCKFDERPFSCICHDKCVGLKK
ncbi:hypothetical protein I4U23_031139 [Adineta vaga]|nr:hypothetical protein I4U23_031139 [Adineta vaga]